VGGLKVSVDNWVFLLSVRLRGALTGATIKKHRIQSPRGGVWSEKKTGSEKIYGEGLRATENGVRAKTKQRMGGRGWLCLGKKGRVQGGLSDGGGVHPVA